MKNLIILIVITLLLVIGGSYLAGNSNDDKGILISQNGIHWHSTISIIINGEEQKIPANIGLVGGHNPMHTHESGGEIHLEFNSNVYENDTRLSEFFKLWRKDFSPTKILDYEGDIKMLVNGEENTEYGDYLLQDGDVVEIILN